MQNDFLNFATSAFYSIKSKFHNLLCTQDNNLHSLAKRKRQKLILRVKTTKRYKKTSFIYARLLVKLRHSLLKQSLNLVYGWSLTATCTNECSTSSEIIV